MHILFWWVVPAQVLMKAHHEKQDLMNTEQKTQNSVQSNNQSRMSVDCQITLSEETLNL